ncbi:hypothetical protein [Sphingobacterium suaedae]|uniref:DUF4209 domain-containing protein n=1 Tax=Sphingobacterium suaedae TaxID=1686402 RepID=A0ABW5KLH0_9SPHI
MVKKRIPVIKFHSIDDLSKGRHLSDVAVLLNAFDPEAEPELNDLFEFYNIRLYFEHQLYPGNWTEVQKQSGKDIVDTLYKILKTRMLEIRDDCFEQELALVDRRYYRDFWKLVADLDIIKHLSPGVLISLLKTDERHVHHILAWKKIVDKFDRTLRDFMLGYGGAAEMILTHLEELNSRNRMPMFLPKSLRPEDKEAIVDAYLDRDEPNLNYIRLIENSRDSDLKISPKTRLKAKRKSDELTERLFSKGNSWSVGVAVSFSTEQTEPVIFKHEGSEMEVIYSESFIDSFTNDVDLFGIFAFLFFFTDSANLINLVSKETELRTLERISMRSRYEYKTGMAFYRKENLSTLQIAIFSHYLKRKGKSIEGLINSYVRHLNNALSEHELSFSLPVDGSGYLYKIRVITPDFDFLLKQYQTLADEGSIDMELIRISSGTLRLSEIGSLMTNKYIYCASEELEKLQHVFFSDQGLFHYIKPFEDKYDCLYDLLVKEQVEYHYFEDYQKDGIDYLLNHGYLGKNETGHIVIKKAMLLYILGCFYKDGVISYWNHSGKVRKVLNELLDAGEVTADNTLFTRQERNYYNYYLNKKEFTNGFDLRNKYLHGTNTSLEKEHEMDYYKLIKLIILTLLKISDDINIKNTNHDLSANLK